MGDIVKCPTDKKTYRKIELRNGLGVLLLSDPDIFNSCTGSGDDGDAAGSAGKASDTEGSDSESGEEGSSGSEEDDDGGSGEGSSGSEEEDEDAGSEEGRKGKPKKKGHHAPVKKAAAAMAVGIGSLSDPDDLPGLSHYLEHMLFMGSTKYPNENEYDDYLTKHGGSSNAFTELETTNYHFDVSPKNLRGALDRFAQFFVAPLCLETSLEREVQAVDSEFAGVIQDDGCRAVQLMCHTAKPGHVYRKFTWGNKLSLWDKPTAAGVDVRGAVLDYYRRHYCAERMSLVLLGGETLDELQSWVTEIFQDLPTGKGPRPSFESMGMPFENRTLYVLPAVRDTHEIVVTFQLPCLTPRYGAKAEHYISHLVGHEGPGSLLSLLKAQGWATDLSAGVEGDGYSQNTGCYLFGVTITLTEAGLHAGPGLGLAPVELLFAYFNMLRQHGPQQWIWQELKSMAEMKFMFLEEEDGMDMCTRLAAVLHLFPAEHIMVAEYLHQEYDPQLITSLLDNCMHPINSSYRLDLLTKEYEPLKQQLVQQADTQTGLLQPAAARGQAPLKVSIETEPWFNMESAWVQVPDELCRTWATSPPPPSLKLPPPNPYIPTDFTIKRRAGHRSHCCHPPGATQHQAQQPSMVAGADTDRCAPSKRARLSSSAAGVHHNATGVHPQPVPAAALATRTAAEAAQIKSVPGDADASSTAASAADSAAAAAASAAVSAAGAGASAADSAAAAGASAASAAHASAVDAGSEAAAEAEACKGLAAELRLPVVLAMPPALIHDSPGLRVWHKLDRVFSTPRVVMYLRLASPVLGASPKAVALNHLMLKLLDDVLNEDTYLADVAGLHYHSSPEGMAGIEFKVEGFSHRLPLLAHRLLSSLATGGPSRANWDTVHEALVRKYRNMAMEVIKQASYERLFALTRHAWHWSVVAPHVEGATLAEVEGYVRELLQRCHLEAFVHGNMDAGEAKEVSEALQKVLGPGCTAAAAGMPRDGTIILPSSSELLDLGRSSEPRSGSRQSSGGALQQDSQPQEAHENPGESKGNLRRRTRASSASGCNSGQAPSEGQKGGRRGSSGKGGIEGGQKDGATQKAGGKGGKGSRAKGGKQGAQGQGQQNGGVSAQQQPFHQYPGLLHQAEARNPAEENAALEVYYQIGLAATCPRALALLDLADQLLCEPMYNQLRTKEQLGYTGGFSDTC
ncbi:Metalloenzyme, LuxS/M16 peptidase-like protein [Dunaliella salina]|uniref:Metalloenzyme, LuxS/M16 peptidase-like protein n=1 Tax=Dunaliella salina TaxID=3046 RepID=A0ABQ7FXE5_DUNSA|nr:Metalloenzyme, LuxS/M16 peptidase-like protein [Dunaliella salina]|eukprot:KAF5827025.1 Metalloenzyme, LuxS/M16 peptidase-like protein [Dunaliella salina]